MAKVVKDGMVQTNVRLSEFADKKLKALAKADDITIGAFIEKMLDSYSVHSKPSNLASGVSDDWRSAVAELSGRVMALESRLEELGAVGEERHEETESVAVIEDLTPCEPVQSVEAETVVVKPVQRQAVEDDAEFDALVMKHGIKDGGGFMGVKAIEKALRNAGYQASQDKVSASLGRLKKG